jgi:hypothetical protein
MSDSNCDRDRIIFYEYMHLGNRADRGSNSSEVPDMLANVANG